MGPQHPNLSTPKKRRSAAQAAHLNLIHNENFSPIQASTRGLPRNTLQRAKALQQQPAQSEEQLATTGQCLHDTRVALQKANARADENYNCFVTSARRSQEQKAIS